MRDPIYFFLCFLFSVLAIARATPADDLVAAVGRNDGESVLQQVGHGANPNEISSQGELPLVLAVTAAHTWPAEILLNYRANASKPQLTKGISAITNAFRRKNLPMSEMILKYGGDPDVLDGNGRSARSFVGEHKQLKELIDRWDKDGARAFEDPPGRWSRHLHEKHGVPYYYNKETRMTRYMVPTSCAWNKATVDGHPIYVNHVTQQTQWTRPAALSWKLLHSPGENSKPYWYNYVNDAISAETPAELSADLVEELSYDGGSYYHNTVTKEASWEDPSENTWRSVNHADRGTFWYHPESGESTWERPEELAWKSVPTEEGQAYYYNERTSSSQWEKPPVLAWEKAQFNPHVNILTGLY